MTEASNSTLAGPVRCVSQPTNGISPAARHRPPSLLLRVSPVLLSPIIDVEPLTPSLVATSTSPSLVATSTSPSRAQSPTIPHSAFTGSRPHSSAELYMSPEPDRIMSLTTKRSHSLLLYPRTSPPLPTTRAFVASQPRSPLSRRGPTLASFNRSPRRNAFQLDRSSLEFDANKSEVGNVAHIGTPGERSEQDAQGKSGGRLVNRADSVEVVGFAGTSELGVSVGKGSGSAIRPGSGGKGATRPSFAGKSATRLGSGHRRLGSGHARHPSGCSNSGHVRSGSSSSHVRAGSNSSHVRAGSYSAHGRAGSSSARTPADSPPSLTSDSAPAQMEITPVPINAGSNVTLLVTRHSKRTSISSLGKRASIGPLNISQPPDLTPTSPLAIRALAGRPVTPRSATFGLAATTMTSQASLGSPHTAPTPRAAKRASYELPKVARLGSLIGRVRPGTAGSNTKGKVGDLSDGRVVASRPNMGRPRTATDASRASTVTSASDITILKTGAVSAEEIELKSRWSLSSSELDGMDAAEVTRSAPPRPTRSPKPPAEQQREETPRRFDASMPARVMIETRIEVVSSPAQSVEDPETIEIRTEVVSSPWPAQSVGETNEPQRASTPLGRILEKWGRTAPSKPSSFLRSFLGREGVNVCVGEGRTTLGPCVGGGNESGSRVTDGGALASRSNWCKSNHEPRMLSRSGSAHESARRGPPRPPPSGPVPATPDFEFALPADRRQREATIRPTHSARGSIDHTLLKALQNGAPPDTTRYRDSITDDSGSDHEDHTHSFQYLDDIPPGTATTSDDARVASHRPHPSLSSRAPITETNIRWSTARSRSGSSASATAWRGASVYEERAPDEDQDDYGLPSPLPADADGMMSPGEYGGIVGPRRDLYSDDELESVIEENESESLSEGDREDRTAAMIIADEGRGQIVDAEGRAVSELEVQPGTTHLLLAHNAAPALLAGFLAQVLPQISTTLLCLDISQNNLGALPPALSACTHLEELNVSFNPLRSLPSSLGALISLRVLIADACELTNLPTQLINLGALHSLSVRSNRLVMLPVWMCAMPSLEVLKLEGNAFAGPWRAIVDPLLPRDMSPVPSPMVANGIYGAARAANSYPLLSSTSNGSLLASPIVLSARLDEPNRPGGGPQRSYSAQPQPSPALGVGPGAGWGIRPSTAQGFGSSPSPGPFYPTSASAPHSPPSKSDTLLPPPPMPVMSPPLSAGGGSTGLAHLHLPSLGPPAHQPPTPNTAAALSMHLGALAPQQRTKKPKKKRGGGSISGSEIATTDAESEVEGRYGDSVTSWASRSVTSPRRMKSADELRRMGSGGTDIAYDDPSAPPSAPIMTTAPTLPEPQGSQVKRYMSLGVRSGSARPDARHMWGGTEGRASRNSTGPRGSRYSARTSGLQAQAVDEDEISPDVSFEFGGSDEGRGISRARSDEAGQISRPDSQFARPDEHGLRFPRSDEQAGSRFSAASVEDAYAHAKSANSSPEEHRRKGRWGFLKKVSMGRLRSHSNAERLGRLPPAQVGNMPGMPEYRKDAMSPPPPASQPISMAMGAAPPRVDVTSAGSPASSVLTARLQYEPGLNGASGSTSPGLLQPGSGGTAPRAKRRSFLPFDTPPTLNIPIPSAEPFMPSVVALGTGEGEEEEAQRRADEEAARVQLALRGVMSYLRDMADLGAAEGGGLIPPLRNGRRPPLTQYMDGRTKSDGSYASSGSTPPMLRSAPSTASLRGGQDSVNTTDSSGSYGQGFAEDRKYKDDKGRRAAIVKEIIETEKSYVKGLQELLDIYVKPSSEPAPGLNVNKETTIPAQERKIVFTGVDALLQFHKMSFLPSLIGAAEILQTSGEDANGQISTRAAHAVANVFVSHAAFMKMYFTYINNFDNAIQRLQFWSAPPSAPNTPGSTTPATPASGTVGVGLSIAMGVAGVAPDQPPHAATLNAGQRKRIKAFLKRARLHPRHSQLNLEGYLLLPIQRIPRYKMLLDNLVTCTPPSPEARDDPLERALEEIAVLASSMNEGKRESESRTKLVQWQSRIRGKFISPLVQPHRRLIMDGRLQLVRLVKKVNSRAEVPNPDGTVAHVEVPCLSSDSNPKQLVAILCNDLLVLCKEPPVAEPNGQVELWAVLRMQTMAQPASIVSGNGLRIVDNKAILYFNTQSTSEALTWQRAINLHIPHSQ